MPIITQIKNVDRWVADHDNRVQQLYQLFELQLGVLEREVWSRQGGFTPEQKIDAYHRAGRALDLFDADAKANAFLFEITGRQRQVIPNGYAVTWDTTGAPTVTYTPPEPQPEPNDSITGSNGDDSLQGE